jgi:hypothetical protein
LVFVPVEIVAALSVLPAPRAATGLRFGAAVAAQWFSSMYVGVMLLSFLAPFLVVMALAWKVRPSRRLAVAGALAAAIVLPAFAGLGLPYVKSRETRGERGIGEVSDGSASPSDYGNAHIRLVSYQWRGGGGHRGERELFPGTSTIALAAVGLVPPFTGATIATIVAGSLTFDWSLGLKGLTYDDLYKRSSIYRGMRVPARFSVVVGAALALLGGFGAARILRLGRTPGARAGICAALTLVVLFDLRLDPRLQSYLPTMPSIYASVTPDMVLAEFPRDNHDIDYMYFSTRHWAHLIGGYSGYVPMPGDVMYGFQHFPEPGALARLRTFGATHVTYNCAFEPRPWRCDSALEALDNNPTLELVASERWQGKDVRLYRFR